MSTKAPHIIEPTAVYDLAQARAALLLTKTTLNREVRLGRLRVCKRAGKYFVLGEWLLEWLRAGEVHRRQAAVVPPIDGEFNGDGEST